MFEIYILMWKYLKYYKAICLTIKLRKNVYRIIPNCQKEKPNAKVVHWDESTDGVGEVDSSRRLWKHAHPCIDSALMWQNST